MTPTQDLYNSLCKDLYSLDIFDKSLNGLLSIIEKNDRHRTILIEKKFAVSSSGERTAGFFFVQCLNSFCNEEQLKEFRKNLEKVVKERAKGNYMEVDPILIAPGYSDIVINFVNQYNNFQRRKPILCRYGK